MFNEPPKIFAITQFDLESVRGNYEIDSLNNPVLNYSLRGDLID
jgi:hypothetical protein